MTQGESLEDCLLIPVHPTESVVLRVAGCGLRVAGCGLRVTGCGLRVTGYGLRVAGCGLRVISLSNALNRYWPGGCERRSFYHDWELNQRETTSGPRPSTLSTKSSLHPTQGPVRYPLSHHFSVQRKNLDSSNKRIINPCVVIQAFTD